jgi:selenocysteine lyase/cysteine desulfurase
MLAIKSSEAMYEARETIANFINSKKSQNIIFTYNATHGLNLVIKGIINSKCHVIISNREHNSVLRPLCKVLKNHQGSLSVFPNSENLESNIDSLIRPDTRALIVNLTSNVTGDELDIGALARIKRKYKLLLILDASQSIGHRQIDVEHLDCDALVAPGHKALFGLQGSGFVYLKNDILLDTLMDGGNGYDTFNRDMGILLPEKYEAGTLATPSIIGMLEGVKFIQEKGIEEIERKIAEYTTKTQESLLSIKGIKILGAGNGIVSFNYKNYPSNSISTLLDKRNIATRSGFHCAPMIHEYLKTTSQGAVRISFSYLNKLQEIDHLYKALKNELKTL